MAPVIEKRHLIAENNSRSGEVYLPSWKSGQSTASVITVTSLLQPNTISLAAEKSGYAFEVGEDQKHAQYENNCTQLGILFEPLAIKVLGGLSRTLKKALLRMSLLADSRNDQSVGQSLPSIEQLMSRAP